MDPYHKIITAWERDPETKHKTLIPYQWATPAIEYLSDKPWICTEKVDGTNIRIQWYGDTVRVRGKTDNAQIPPKLLDRMNERFDAQTLEEVFGDTDACLYGEGYGAGIQKGGGLYDVDGQDFVLFDVHIGMWLERPNVEDIGSKLGVPTVPVVFVGSLSAAVEMVRDDAVFLSMLGHREAEGLVMRPQVEMHDRRGDRIITKIKRKDFRR